MFLLFILIPNISVLKRRLDITQGRIRNGNNAAPKYNEVIYYIVNMGPRQLKLEFIQYASWPVKALNS